MLRTVDPIAVLNRRVLFPAWVRKNRSRRLAYVREFQRSQYMPSDELRERQFQLFKALLEHAYVHCPFYRGKLTAAGMTPADLRTLDDVARVPVTTKQEIQESADRLLADNADRSRLLRDMTGGSTGAPMVFYYDEDRLDSRAAATIRHNRWTGWDIGEKMAVLWGAPRDLAAPPSLKDRVRDWIIDRRILLDASAIDEVRMQHFYGELRDSRVAFMLAYANTAALFARFVSANRLSVPGLRSIITSAELLTPDNRSLIESTFGCPVFNRYGSREFAVIASECERHDGMHINAENLLVEVALPNPNSVDGEIIVTDLKNRAMPMIRYRTMDVGHLRSNGCTCGRSLPLLELTGGRTTDFLIGQDQRRVSGIVLATYVITNIPGIRQIQFVQEHAGAVRIRLARGPLWSDEALRSLVSRAREFLGEGMGIEIDYVEEIPLEKSGKYRFSVSKLIA